MRAPAQERRAFNFMYDCIYFYDTASASSSVPILASSTCALSTSSPAIATSSDIAILPSLTAGEILNASLLFSLIVILMGRFVVDSVTAITTKKRFLGYGGGDVELRDDV